MTIITIKQLMDNYSEYSDTVTFQEYIEDQINLGELIFDGKSYYLPVDEEIYL